MEVDNLDAESMGCDQGVHQKVSKASRVMMSGDRKLLQEPFCRQRCIVAMQYLICIDCQLVIQRTTPLPCRCVSPTADLTGVGELPQPSLYAVECRERFAKRFAQSKELLRRERRSLQAAIKVDVTFCDHDPAFGATACHVGTL